MFDELGPTFVKFGQLLSTRPDVVPPDIIVELRKLQDDVTPVPYDQVEQVVQAELGLPIERLFLEFSERPIAAASIGQVHDADAPERPPRRREGAAAERAPSRSRPTSSFSTRRRRSRRSASARSTSSTRAVSSTSSAARSGRSSTTGTRRGTPRPSTATSPATRTSAIPKVFWSYSRARVLTLEYLDGTQIQDVDPDEYSLEERRRLAYLMAEAWMTMIFRHGVFHGDPHPANILVLGRRSGSASSTSGSPGSCPTTT